MFWLLNSVSLVTKPTGTYCLIPFRCALHYTVSTNMPSDLQIFASAVSNQLLIPSTIIFTSEINFFIVCNFYLELSHGLSSTLTFIYFSISL